MAKIYNSQLSEELVEGANIQQSADKVPNELAEKVVPVMEVNPKLLKVVDVLGHGSTSSTGSVTALTTPSYGTTYLTGFSINWDKDAACDNVAMEVLVTVGGVLKRLAIINSITLTVNQGSMSKDFTVPIPLDVSSTVQLSGNFTVGVLAKSICVTGYRVED